MSTYTLHIFDAIARDQKVLRATEEELQVEYIDDDNCDSDDEFISNQRSQNGKNSIENREMIIHLFGSTAKGEHVRIEVQGFKPFFYISIPPCATATDEEKWKMKVELVLQTRFHKQASTIQCQVTKKKKLFGYTANRLFPFIKMTFPSLGMYFEARKYFSEPGNLIKAKLTPGVNLYESNIDPMLRFFHMRNINPCGWIKVNTLDVNDEDPLLLQLVTDWESVSPCDAPPGFVTAPFKHAFWDIECYSHDNEFPVPKQGYRRVANQIWQHAVHAEDIPGLIRDAFAKKGTIQIPPLKHEALRPKAKEIAIASENKKFKESLEVLWKGREKINIKEKKERIKELTSLLDTYFGRMAPIAGDPIIQIGTTSWRYGSNNAERHIFVLGGCDDIPGAVVHHANTEQELLLKWFTWCIDQSFDTFVGYNIFKFDEGYVWDRLCELGLEQEPCVQSMNRLFNEGGGMKLEEKFLSSAALGDNKLYMWTTTGRLRIDLLAHITRKVQLPGYKLDEVAAAFLSGKLSGIEDRGNNQWFLQTNQKGDARIGRYVQILDELGEDLTDKMPIVAIEANGFVVETEEVLNAIGGEATKWAMVKDDIIPSQIFEFHRGTNTDRARVASYCIQDCDLVMELYRKLEVFNEAMSMANVCSVPVSYIFTRGQGIKIESLIFKDCMASDQLIEVLPSTYGDSSLEKEDSYEGAIVLDPEPGFYVDAPVGVCDFSSLYPSTIISENISHDMLVWVKDYDLSGKFIKLTYGSEQAESYAPPGTQFTDIEFDIWRPDPQDTRKNPEKIKVGVRLCRYAQPPNNVKGSLPIIVGKLLSTRNAKKKEMAKTDDPFKKALLDAEQNAYKVTANSLYGQLGSSTFKIRLQHLAASVTAYGRKQILFSKDAIETFYGPAAKDPRCEAKVVYGDTDSIFVCFYPKDPVTGKGYEGREAIVKTIELTEEVGQFITGALKAPHDFEYDKVFYPFIIFSKKRYVGNKYEESPDEFKETSMGIVLKRRDNAPICKMCYSAAIDSLLNRRDIPGAVQGVKEKIKELVEGRMKLSQLTITKSLSANYKGAAPAHKMLADRIAARDPGNAPVSGERIGFVYIQPPVGQQASKLQGERIETPSFIQEKKLKPDVEYYIDHQLYNPLTELFGLFVERMPGFKAPHQWDQNPDKCIAQREKIAGDLLFKDGITACSKSAMRNFISFFNGGKEVEGKEKIYRKPKVIEANEEVAKRITKAIGSSSAKQTTITKFLLETAVMDDERLMKNMMAAKRNTRASAKNKETIKSKNNGESVTLEI